MSDEPTTQLGTHTALISRDDAVALITRQFDDGDIKERFKKSDKSKYMPHHYGKCELTELITAIYGEKNDEGS